MSNTYNLADLRNDLDSKHQSLVLDLDSVTIELINAVRLDAHVRKAVMQDIRLIQHESEKDEQDPVLLDAAVNRVLAAVVADGKGQLLTDIIAGDTGLAFRVFELWMTVTQAGEASSLPD